MFIRPDWRDPTNYSENDIAPYDLAWEFLRRNPEYQHDYSTFQQGGRCDLDGWNEHNALTWRLRTPVAPENDGGGHEFIWEIYDRPEQYQSVISGRVEGPHVLIPVDLSAPFETLVDRVKATLRQLRQQGIRAGTVVPRTSRILSNQVYLKYLRILDALDAGAPLSEIGDVLAPGAVNDPDDRQRDKNIRAAKVAAIKMQTDGYLALLTD